MIDQYWVGMIIPRLPEPPIPPRTEHEFIKTLEWLDLRAKIRVREKTGTIIIRVKRDAAVLLTMWLGPQRMVGTTIVVRGDLRWFECLINKVQSKRITS